MRVAIRAAAIGQTLHAALLTAFEDLVTGLAGNAKLPAQIRHRFTG
jgi:hypothetical protein